MAYLAPIQRSKQTGLCENVSNTESGPIASNPFFKNVACQFFEILSHLYRHGGISYDVACFSTTVGFRFAFPCVGRLRTYF